MGVLHLVLHLVNTNSDLCLFRHSRFRLIISGDWAEPALIYEISGLVHPKLLQYAIERVRVVTIVLTFAGNKVVTGSSLIREWDVTLRGT